MNGVGGFWRDKLTNRYPVRLRYPRHRRGGYDSHGNLTNIQDPLHNLTSMTYTSIGEVQTVRRCQ